MGETLVIVFLAVIVGIIGVLLLIESPKERSQLNLHVAIIGLFGVLLVILIMLAPLWI